jgi:hypothetical protein
MTPRVGKRFPGLGFLERPKPELVWKSLHVKIMILDSVQGSEPGDIFLGTIVQPDLGAPFIAPTTQAANFTGLRDVTGRHFA